MRRVHPREVVFVGSYALTFAALALDYFSESITTTGISIYTVDIMYRVAAGAWLVAIVLIARVAIVCGTDAIVRKQCCMFLLLLLLQPLLAVATIAILSQ